MFALSLARWRRVFVVSGCHWCRCSAVKDPKGRTKLAGYVTPGSVDVAAMLAHCRANLLASMVPSTIVAMESFPLLPNGKVDVRSLPEPEWDGGVDVYVAPATEVEEQVCQAFQEVLGSADPVSVTADFFACGGTSLQVFRVVSKLHSLLGVDGISPVLVHEGRTPRAVAAELASGGAGGPFGPRLEPVSWEGSFRPLSQNQLQMWLLAQAGRVLRTTCRLPLTWGAPSTFPVCSRL